ncbi:MAG: hypothetical protein Q7S42_05950 [Candidatus Omnitrophota bacterium]|nr:hypothetical protein [Candidatus Omnitrophota bacterium]
MKNKVIIIGLSCLTVLVFQAILLTGIARKAVPFSYFGNHISNKGNWPSIAIGSLRMWDDNTSWELVEKSRGEYDWSAIDYWLGQAESRGINVVYTFGYSPAWARAGGKGIDPPLYTVYWDEFVTALVSRYKGRIKFYEGWNESNDPGFWSGTIEKAVELQKNAYRIIHRIDPVAKVITPPPTADHAAVWLDKFFEAGGGKYADIISFHGYTHPTSEEIVGLVKNVRSVMRKYGQNRKPLWVSEGGWGKVDDLSDPDLQAAFLAKHYLLLWSNDVERFYWYSWDNDPWGTLWDKQNGIHKAGIAYREVQKWMVGSTMVNPCSMDKDSTWTCGLRLADGSWGLAVWNSKHAQDYRPKDNFIQGLDLQGNSFAVNGFVTIGNNPVLLKGKK